MNLQHPETDFCPRRFAHSSRDKGSPLYRAMNSPAFASSIKNKPRPAPGIWDFFSYAYLFGLMTGRLLVAARFCSSFWFDRWFSGYYGCLRCSGMRCFTASAVVVGVRCGCSWAVVFGCRGGWSWDCGCGGGCRCRSVRCVWLYWCV